MKPYKSISKCDRYEGASSEFNNIHINEESIFGIVKINESFISTIIQDNDCNVIVSETQIDSFLCVF